MKYLKISVLVFIIPLLMTGVIHSKEVVNIARNPSFEDGTVEWQLLITAPAAAKWEVEKEGGVAGQCVHINVSAVTGTSWHVEIHQGGQAFKADQKYTFDFWAKASEMRAIQPGMEGLGGSDWWQDFNIKEEWVEFKRTWVQSLTGSATIHLAIAQSKGDIWIDHFRLYEGDYVEEDFDKLNKQTKKAVDVNGKLAATWCGIKSIK